MIFYAEDDAEDRELFSEVIALIDPNDTLLFASNGLEAIEMLQNMNRPPKIIFLDVNMPVLTGAECVKQIKSIDRLRNIPVVIFSTTSNIDEIKKLKQLGAEEYIIKPNTFDELKDVVTGVINKYSRLP